MNNLPKCNKKVDEIDLLNAGLRTPAALQQVYPKTIESVTLRPDGNYFSVAFGGCVRSSLPAHPVDSCFTPLQINASVFN